MCAKCKKIKKILYTYIYEIVKEEKWKNIKEKLAIDVILTTPNQQPGTATSSGVQPIIIFNNNIKYLTRLTQLRAASLAHTEYLFDSCCLLITLLLSILNEKCFPQQQQQQQLEELIAALW